MWLGYELDMEPFHVILYGIYTIITKASTDWVWSGEATLFKEEVTVQRNPSYSFNVCLHGMCPSSTIGK